MSTVTLLAAALPAGVTAVGWLSSTQRAGRLRRQLLTDRLTGLANRDALADRVAAISPRAAAVGLLLVDLDQFKPVNDRYGHDEGDRVLCAIAQRLQGLARGGELAVRLHGDEFAFLLGAVPSGRGGQRAAHHRARTVREAIRRPITTAAACHRVDASVGIAIQPATGADLATLLGAADTAMYANKPHGPDRRQRQRPSSPAHTGHASSAAGRGEQP